MRLPKRSGDCSMAEKFSGLIDEPSHFDTLQTWERHLQRLLALDPADDFRAIRAHMIRNARMIIAEIKAHSARPSSA